MIRPPAPASYRALLRLALREDLGTGDVSTRAVVPRAARGRAFIRAKAAGLLAGLPVAAEVCRHVDPALQLRRCAAEGARVAPGDTVAELRGPARAILAAERTLLNFLQRLSGIATLTRAYVDAVQGTGARIYDTRKTLPGHRILDKYAVRIGGGENHRFGLYDQILLKENHFAAARAAGLSFAAAVRAACRRSRGRYPVEVEVENLQQFRVALEAGADIILLDDFPLPRLRQAVAEARRRKPRPILEASGGMTLKRVRRVAETGVDRISVGALTHSAPALDLALYLA